MLSSFHVYPNHNDDVLVSKVKHRRSQDFRCAGGGVTHSISTSKADDLSQKVNTPFLRVLVYPAH